MQRKAFTMLELVVVMVILGVIINISMPNLSRNSRNIMTQQVVEHIRYAQHLAMQDDRFNPDDTNWFRKLWKVRFSQITKDNYGTAYSIHREGDGGNITQLNKDDPIAIDPLTGKLLTGGNNEGYDYFTATDLEKITKKMNLSQEYGVLKGGAGLVFSGGCTWSGISFDYLGRPIVEDNTFAPYDRLLTVPCIITIKHPDGDVQITIAPETGYVTAG